MPPRAPSNANGHQSAGLTLRCLEQFRKHTADQVRRWPPAASSETLADQQEFGSCHPKRRKCRRGQAAHSATSRHE